MSDPLILLSAVAASVLFVATRLLPSKAALFIALPGTITHELLHFVVAVALGGKPSGISFIPKRDPEDPSAWVLGQVRVTDVRWFNAVPIGLAPLGTLALFGFLPPHSVLASAAWAVVLPGCLPSPADWHLAFSRPLSPLLYLAVPAFIFWRMHSGA